MVVQTASVAADDTPSGEQTAKITLAYALLRSRQRMSTEVSVSARVGDQDTKHWFEINLDIKEDDEVQSLLQTISLASKSSSSFENTNESIQIRSVGQQWEIQAEYDGGPTSTPQDTFSHVYSQVFQSQPQGKISQIETIREDDVQWLMNNAIHPIPAPNDTDTVAMFRHAATQWAQKTAVEAWDGGFIYSELEEESTQLANFLISEGVRTATILPLIFEFSKWTLVSLLATWKAGAAFVFLDPTHPITRLQTLVKRVEAPIVLSQDIHQDQLRDLPARVISVDQYINQKQYQIGQESKLPDSINADGPAYVIFTSGSTGEPKAVVHTHLAFCSGALHQSQFLGYSSQTRTLQNAPLIFAGAIPELLFTILQGGCLCIPKQEDRIKDLPGCVRHHQSNMLIISSSSAAIQDPEKFSPRQRLLVGAEPLPAHTAQKWAALHDSCNGYGSTETNTVATCCPSNTAVTSHSVGPGAAHQYWIVDALNYDRLAPPGWLGEVVVEGHALASEYLGNEEATFKSFPAAPKWYSKLALRRSGTSRFFRSGDLGRIATDGTLEVHGRTDPLQVKLRGQRIELGEIEAITMDGLHKPTPLVAELILPRGQERPSIAVFVVGGGLVDDLDGELLAEHVTLSSSQRTQLDRLKDQLGEAWTRSLPSFMRPSYLIPLIKMPRTATGKLDRQKLRQWTSRYEAFELAVFSTLNSSGTAKPLASDTELKLAKAFEKVLKVSAEQIDGSSVFTVLGGDSLGAIQLSQELRGIGSTASPADIISSSDLSMLAELLDGAPSVNGDLEMSEDSDRAMSLDSESILDSLRLETDQVQAILPTTNSQSRAIDLGTGPERSFVYHFVLKPEGQLDLPKLVAALQRLVDRHDVLRTLFTRHEGKVVQVVLKHLQCPLELQDIEGEQTIDETISHIATSDVILNEVPTRFWVLAANSIPKAIILRLSHAQFDGISIPLLWDSLAEIYSGQALSAAPQYQTYARAVLLRDLTPSMNYFKELLRDCPFTDLVKRSTSTHQPQNRHFTRTVSLKPAAGFTPAHLFEAAWGYVLARASHTRAIVFDQIVSGRQLSLPKDYDVSKLIGACLNDIPVVVRFPKGRTVGQLLAQIRDQHAETAKYETLGFNRILGECKPSHWPQDARMKSSVQYRGFEARSSFSIGDVECQATMIERSMDLEDLTVFVTPMRSPGDRGKFEVEFLFSDEVVKDLQAEYWFEELLRSVHAFAEAGAFDKEVEMLLGEIDD